MLGGKTVCSDWQNDIEGKPESKESKTMRDVVQIASMFAKRVAESGVLSDTDSMAVKALARARLRLRLTPTGKRGPSLGVGIIIILS